MLFRLIVEERSDYIAVAHLSFHQTSILAYVITKPYRTGTLVPYY